MKWLDSASRESLAMSMVCPKCNASFEQRIQCPTCSVRLLYQAAPRSAAPGLPGQAQWQHTPFGRIFVGLLLAQGLYHGLQQLCTAGLLATSAESSKEVWATLFGLVLLQGLQAVGLLVGGMLAGAGQRRGMLIGTVLGILFCLILFVIDLLSSRRLTSFAALGEAATWNSVTGYGQPLLLIALSAMGGLMGSLVWRPLPTLTVPGVDKRGSLGLSGRRKPGLFDGPIAWGRVAFGVGLVVAGNCWANVILKFALDSSEGTLTISSRLQAHLVTMEICALAAVIGSALAGATTLNGLKQGLCVGVVATVTLLSVQMQSSHPAANKMIFTALSTLGLSMAGGWFGGHLFPPVYAPVRRKVHAPSVSVP
jgi:hypothetical protein